MNIRKSYNSRQNVNRQSHEIIKAKKNRSRSIVEIEKWKLQDKENKHSSYKSDKSLKSEVERLQRELNLRDAKHKLAEEKLYCQIEELITKNEEMKKELEHFKGLVKSGNGFEVSMRNKQCWKEESQAASKVKNEIKTTDGKIQKLYEDGHKEVIFPNGVRKEVYPNGYVEVVFGNGDVKQDFPDGKVIYTFQSSRTVQTNYPSGLKVFNFASGQIEKHIPDGSKQITYPDGTVKTIGNDNYEEIVFPDGVTQRTEQSGIQTVIYPTGQQDVLYPDGSKARKDWNLPKNK